LDTAFLPKPVYRLLFFVLAFVYVCGLFVPLMDNDSAHHANIALHMYLTGDYVNLVDYGKDYLDKPHLHFWLCAFSYKIFGVTTFAYKFPSFLFTILGTYSTYRLGRALYAPEIGRLSALIVASAFAYMLANNDVRMDAILTASIAFATWQLVEFVQYKRLLNVAGAALGLALGFCTKGHIAVFTPVVAIAFYILYRKEWTILYNWKWLLLIVVFGLFVSPVVYCYYLQYNLHPEKVVRAKDHINGVNFILFNQSVERFGGTMGSDAKNDRLFFLHSFLWAFAPWSIIAFTALFKRLKTFLRRSEEWLTVGVFMVMLIIISFSGFKLPHYLNIVFPTTSVLTASFILNKREQLNWSRIIYSIQFIAVVLLLVLLAVINIWAFPVHTAWIIVGSILLLALVFYFIRSEVYNKLQKAICMSAATMAFAFFLLNTNFYPQLLTYQGGNQLAFQTRGKVDPTTVYLWKEHYSSSWNFYTKTIRKELIDSSNLNNVWLLYDIRNEEEIKHAGYTIGERYVVPDYEITKLDIKFINPEKRENQCTKMILANITR
jgi:4-amino-4-deoxy-L-arabinose transferase-like glycosyltransferase